LSTDVKASSGKISFNLVKGCKSMDYPDGNAAIAWERLKNKYEPISVPSMVKWEKHFRSLALKKGQDPEVWIIELEDLRMRLDEMGSTISENQFMIHVLNNLTSDYDLQLALMERKVGDTEKPLTVQEIRSELGLCVKSLNLSANGSQESGIVGEHALFSGQLKDKCRNCGQIGHKAFQYKKKLNNNSGNSGNTTEQNYCS
jgi:hypothetical protein